jgi:hypothetical protein
MAWSSAAAVSASASNRGKKKRQGPDRGSLANFLIEASASVAIADSTGDDIAIRRAMAHYPHHAPLIVLVFADQLVTVAAAADVDTDAARPNLDALTESHGKG